MSAQLPETGFLRLHQILGNPHANPPTPPLIPIGKSTWWAGVRAGRFPAAIKIGQNTTAWSVTAIRDLIDRLNNGDEGLSNQQDE